MLRTAQEHLRNLRSHDLQSEFEMVGKKGVSYMRFLGMPLAHTMTDIEDHIEFSRVEEMANRYITAYEAGAIARVDVVYMRFHSIGSQLPLVAQLLPIEPPPQKDDELPVGKVDFEFSPEPGALLERLIPETVKVRLYQCFNDAILSEQVARMVAMKAATDSAGDMIKFLTRQYNRARQTQITLELADIVGGAEALK